MLKLGLTGGIASGKSAVAAMLREMGFAVLEADLVAHKVIEPGQATHDEVVAAFGPEIIGDNGRINRAWLGALVFADREKLQKLNAIVHPRVREAILQQLKEWESEGKRDVVFVEAALLVEAGYVKALDGLVVVWCRPEQQLQRMVARGFDETEAQRRMAAQMDVAEKLHYATYTIDCSETLEDTRQQVSALVEKIRHTAKETKGSRAPSKTGSGTES